MTPPTATAAPAPAAAAAPPTTDAPTTAAVSASAPASAAVRSGPLASRPRRQRVQRPPSQRAAARAVRRTAPPTTGSTWRRSGLDGPVRASTGVPVSEAVASCTALALVFVPLALWVGVGPAVLLGALAVGALAYVLWARRVLVGDSWVAVRQLGRYHVATVDHVRHLELKPSERGGVLCLHTDDGRCMRLRRVEIADPAVGTALRTWWAAGTGTHDDRVAALLDLPHESGRIRHRYLADATG